MNDWLSSRSQHAEEVYKNLRANTTVPVVRADAVIHQCDFAIGFFKVQPTYLRISMSDYRRIFESPPCRKGSLFLLVLPFTAKMSCDVGRNVRLNGFRVDPPSEIQIFGSSLPEGYVPTHSRPLLSIIKTRIRVARSCGYTTERAHFILCDSV